MHINLSSVSEPQKLNKVALEAPEGAGEHSEEPGFLSRLSALIDGDSEKKIDEKASVAQGIEGELKTQESAEANGDAIDAADDSIEDEAVTALLEDTLASEQDVESATAQASDAEQTMQESNQLLGRLEQASKALQQENGNPLPPSQLAEESQLNEQQGDGESVAELDATDDSSHGEQLEISPLLARFIENSPEDKTLASSQSSQTGDNAELGPLGNSSAQYVVGLPNGMGESDVSHSEGDDTKGNDSQGVDASLEAFPQSGASGNENTMVGENGEKGIAGEDVDNEVVTAGSAPTQSSSTIPWGTSQTTIDEQMAQDLASKTRPATVSQSVQQALNAQGLTHPASNQQALAQQASGVNVPLTMDGQPASQVTPNAAMMAALQNSAPQDQALLKAALGAKAAASLSQLGASEGSPSGAEASFAQQLSQAAGPLGLNAQALNRSDQAAAQMPMTLNREMASEQVAERMQMMLSKNLKNIDIRLDPPELGRMQIRMNMNGDSASVQFTVANQQARDIIEQSMPRLREMLSQQGLQLGDTSVQQQSAGQQQGRYAAGNETGSGQGSSSQHGFGEENLEPDVNLDLNVTAKRDGISYYA